MAIEFSKITDIVIPEGNVTKITDTNNTRTIWTKEVTPTRVYLIKDGKFTDGTTLVKNNNYVVTENYDLNGTPVVEIIYNGSNYDDNDVVHYKKTSGIPTGITWSRTTYGTMAIMVNTSAGGSWSTSSFVAVNGSDEIDDTEPSIYSAWMEIKDKRNYNAVQYVTDEAQLELKDVTFSNYSMYSDTKAIWYRMWYRFVSTPPLGQKVRWFIKDLYRQQD